MQTLHHKKNELFEVEFYADKECTEAFDFTNAKNLYIDGQFNLQTVNCVIEKSKIKDAQIFIPYIPQCCVNSIISAIISRNCDNKEPSDYDDVKVLTLSNIDPMWDDEKIKTITPNLSKYIPEDNAVLFLSEDDCDKYCECFDTYFVYPQGLLPRVVNSEMDIRDWQKITIFLHYGTQAEFQKAEEVSKYLWENFGIKPNLVVLHLFYEDGVTLYQLADLCNKMEKAITQNEVKEPVKMYNFNKIITTNSTGILKPEDSKERLQVIDCKEIFEEI